MRDERGSALLMTLIVTIAMAILAGAMVQYAFLDARFFARDKDRMQAYYLAWSGAHAVAQYIIYNPDLVSELVDATDVDNPATGSLNAGTFIVNILDLSSDLSNIRIDSTGIVGTIEETVSLRLVLVPVEETLFEKTVFSTGNIKMWGNASVEGNIAANGSIDINSPARVSGSVSQGENRAYPQPKIPEDIIIHKHSDLKISGGEPFIIDDNYEFNEITLTGKSKLIFDLDKIEGNMYVKVKTFSAKSGTVEVKGSGRLFLLVEDFTGGGNFLNNTGAPGSLVLFLPPTGSLNFGGTPEFNGAIYAPDASINLWGTARITGAMVAGEFKQWGNTKVIHSHVDVQGLPLETTTFESSTNSYKRDYWSGK